MKYFLKYAVILAVLSVFIISLSVISASAAANTVYISADGTGDGSSPDKPLGNISGYVPGNKTEPNNAFYRGLDKLKNTGGTLVIVGDVAIDCVEARFSNSETEKLPPSEFRTPKFANGKNVLITSVYNSVDYRKKGAELILDYATCNTTAMAFGCPTTLQNLNIQYRYNESAPNSWNTPFMLCGGGYSFTVSDGVNVTSFNTKTNSEGDQYPMIVGGHRYADINKNYSLVIKSGTWSTVIGGSCGIAVTSYGKVNGNVTVTLSGGKIGTFVGTGCLTQSSNTIYGTLTVNVTGGEIDKFYVTHPFEYYGNRITVNLAARSNVSEFFYAPLDYTGNLGELVSKVNIKNSSKLKIEVPDVQLPETTPADEVPETSVAETQAPTVKQEPVEEGNPIPPIIWVLLLILAAVIGTATYILNTIKLNMLK